MLHILNIKNLAKYEENNRIEAKKPKADCPTASGKPTLPSPTPTAVSSSSVSTKCPTTHS